jgi:hypothetical protein
MIVMGEYKRWHILSLGAGVQSSTLALMAAHGELRAVGYPQPDVAIFADTQDEPASVYRWLDWLEAEIARCPFPFPVHRVTHGKLSDSAIKMKVTRDGRRCTSADIPVFVLRADGVISKIKARACTADFKIKPLISAAQELVGRADMNAWRRAHRNDLRVITAYRKSLLQWRRRQEGYVPHFPQVEWDRCQADALVNQWIGISLDEVRRMKDSRDAYIKSNWPLIDMRMNRGDCKLWMKNRGYPEPPRSACKQCPYHSNDEWRRLKMEEPEEFAGAVQIERDLQKAKGNSENFHSVPFLHRSCVPLDQVDFDNDVDRGQQLFDWGDECEGMCGV